MVAEGYNSPTVAPPMSALAVVQSHQMPGKKWRVCSVAVSGPIVMMIDIISAVNTVDSALEACAV